MSALAASLPQMPGAAPAGAPAPMDLSALVGQPAAQPRPAVDQQSVARSVMTQIRDLQMNLEGFVRQFPEVPGLGEKAAEVKRMLVEIMTMAVGSLNAAESGPAPPVLG